MNELSLRPPQMIISETHAQPQTKRFHWLNYFDPQAALVDFVNYVETQPSSRNEERHTMRVYLASLADFCRHLGAFVTHTPGKEDYVFDFNPMEFPSHTAVTEYMAYSSKSGRSASTINRYMSAIRHFLRALELQPMMNLNDQQDMFFWIEAQRQLRLAISSKSAKSDVTTNRPALENHGTRLSLIDVNRLFAYFENKMDTLSGKRDVAMLYLGITTGLRASEIARLTPNNIKFGDGCYEIRVRGKRNNYDPVALDGDGYELIQSWMMAYNATLPEGDERCITGDTPIFQPLLHNHLPMQITDRYHPRRGLSSRAVLKIVERRTFAALEFSVGAHDLRRTCAYLMRNHGFAIEQIRDMLRHRSSSTTDKYIGKHLNLKAMLMSSRVSIFVPHQSGGVA